MKTLFSLFKQNLNKAQMLTYVFVFNSQTWEEELEFVYGTNDKEQWKVSLKKVVHFFQLKPRISPIY